MFESSLARSVRDLAAGLAGHDGAALDDSALVDAIAALEELKSAACAAQARLTVALDTSVRRAAADRAAAAARSGGRTAKVDVAAVARDVASQVALARRESPARGSRLVGLARVLVAEMPETLAALTRGETSEWRATVVARETATLEAADRRRVDADLGPRLAGLGDRATADEARRAAYALDPAQLVARTARAEADRTVSIRPAPDCMTYVTALLPVAQGVAVHAALTAHADSLRAQGDQRSRGAIKADTLVSRLTGTADDPVSPWAPAVSLSLVVSDATLLGADDQPGHLVGHGPVPAFLARRIVAAAPRAWLRRLYASPTGDLVGADARTRFFPASFRAVLVARDQWCRTPWCGAPVRHADHVHRHADGGETSLANGQGLCERCSQAKEAPGWRSRVAPGHRHRVETRTPTGHTYDSTAPPLPVPWRESLLLAAPLPMPPPAARAPARARQPDDRVDVWWAA